MSWEGGARDPALGTPALRRPPTSGGPASEPRPREVLASPGSTSPRAAPGLTCRVPDGDVVGAPLLQVESTAHRADRVREAPLHVPLQQRRLAHVHVPQKHDLPVGLPHGPAGRAPSPALRAHPARAPREPPEQPTAAPGLAGSPNLREPAGTLPLRRLGRRKRRHVFEPGQEGKPDPAATRGVQTAAVRTDPGAPDPASGAQIPPRSRPRPRPAAPPPPQAPPLTPPPPGPRPPPSAAARSGGLGSGPRGWGGRGRGPEPVGSSRPPTQCPPAARGPLSAAAQM